MVFRCFTRWSVVIIVTLNVVNPQISTPIQQKPPNCVHMPPQAPMIPMPPPLPPMVPMAPPPAPNMIPMAPAAPPPFPMPFHLPMPIPMGIGVAFIQEDQAKETVITTTTSTTTTVKPFVENDVNSIAIAMPMPLPPMMGPQLVQFAIPGEIPSYCKTDRRHPSCPPCPPCSCNPCTPSFFSYCSKCHQKCRCKNDKDVPVPLPLTPPMPLPMPAFPMPLPMPSPFSIPNSPHIIYVPYSPEMVPPRKTKRRDYSCERHYSEESDEFSDSSIYSRGEENKKRPYINNGIYGRRHRNGDQHIDDIHLKPELNYLTDDGVVKIKKNLNKGEAMRLLAEDDYDENMHMETERYSKRKHSKGPNERTKKRFH